MAVILNLWCNFALLFSNLFLVLFAASMACCCSGGCLIQGISWLPAGERMHLFAWGMFWQSHYSASCLIIIMSCHPLKLPDHLFTTFFEMKKELIFTWTNSSVLDCMMFALLEVVDWHLEMVTAGDWWTSGCLHVSDTCLVRFPALLRRKDVCINSSRMLMMMTNRQPSSQISTAVIVLAGGVADLVMVSMLSRTIVTTSSTERRSRGWDSRYDSQEMATRMEEGRYRDKM